MAEITFEPDEDIVLSAEQFPSGLEGTLGYRIKDKCTGEMSARETDGIEEDLGGSGVYSLTIPAGTYGPSRYKVIWDTGALSPGSTATEDFKIGVTVASNASQLASLQSALGGAEIAVTLVSPLSSIGDLEIVQGDDYLAADGRALEWATVSEDAWPDLTGATITFATTAGFRTTGAVLAATGATKRVRVQLTASETELMKAGNRWRYAVEAVLDNDSTVTLQRGALTVLRDVR